MTFSGVWICSSCGGINGLGQEEECTCKSCGKTKGKK